MSISISSADLATLAGGGSISIQGPKPIPVPPPIATPPPPVQPPPTTVLHKFAGAMDFMMVPQYGGQNSGSTQNDLGWIKQFKINPADALAIQVQWSDVDNGASPSNSVSDAQNGTGNFLGFRKRIGNTFNLLQTYNRGKPMAAFLNTINIWLGNVPSGKMTCSIPDWMLNCNGALTLADSFGASTSKNFTLFKHKNGQSGFNFYAYDSSKGPNYYDFLVAAYQDPAVVRAIGNTRRALMREFKLQMSAPYSATAAYDLGDLVNTGTGASTKYFCSVQTDPKENDTNVGHALTDTAWWMPSSADYAGKTIDECDILLVLHNNDETSANFSKGPWVTGSTGPANLLTGENYLKGYLATIKEAAAIGQRTPAAGCFTYVITGADGVTYDAGKWTALLADLFSVQGTAFSQADIAPNQFKPGSAHASGAMLALAGLNPDKDFKGTFDPLGSFSHSYLGERLIVGQVQPQDYRCVKGSPPTQAQLEGLIATLTALGANYRFWSCQDEANYDTKSWPVIQAAFKKAPANAVRPTGLA